MSSISRPTVDMKKNKTDILSKFIEDNRNLPEQGSSEWLEQRKMYFGGSDIATLIG